MMSLGLLITVDMGNRRDNQTNTADEACPQVSIVNKKELRPSQMVRKRR
jgi:hypothetical protein